MQSRFKLIPDTHLNGETVAAIQDMNLGRVRDGKSVGKFIENISNLKKKLI